jgi:predicted CxxxxCH...CXXCH cytochrome family protein
MSGPLAADLTQQTVATVPVTLNSGGATVSSYTVNLSGSVTAGDVAGVYVADGTNIWSATGSYGNGSSVVCSGSNAIPGATLSIKVTLNASADAKTIAVTLQTDSNTASSLPKGPSSALTISAPSGPASTIADCGGCHAYPPEDGTARNTPVGAVIGDHAKHAYACSNCHVTPATTTPADHGHRNKNIDMATPIFGGSGGYSRGISFAQSNNPTTGTCSNISCHNNSETPQWGVGTTACDTCHALPPATGAHSAHYTGKGWTTGATTDCTQCHPDNTTIHSDVIDGTPVVTRTNTSYAAGSCSGTGIGLGCHNEYATPVWASGTATCTSCHAAGGGKATDPASGLHAVTPTITGQAHDDSVSGGCAACHTSLGVSHTDGTFTGDANLGLAAFYSQSAADTGTCLTTGCHTGRDDWTHTWTTAANAYTTDVTACANCHGVNAAVANLGTTGVVHRAVTAKHTTGTNYTCKDCHAIEGAGYTYSWSTNDWSGTSNHGNGSVDINSTGTSFNQTNGLCESCHTVADGTHDFQDTAWPIAAVAGDAINTTCGECHTGGVTTGAASGAHTVHNAGTAALVAGGADCVACHGDNGGLGYENTLAGSHGNSSVTFSGATYSTAVRNDLTGTCSTTSCHNKGTDQSTAWNSNALACDDCHYYAATTTPTTAGNIGHASPLSTDHGNHFGTGGNFACADCHGTDPVAEDTTHINGVTTLADKATAVQDEANVTVTGWVDGTDTCNNAACHNPSGTTYSAIWQTSTASCTLCHSDTDPGTGSHNAHMTAATLFGINTLACTSCHVNNGTNNAHRDGVVTMAVGMNYTGGAEDVLGTVGSCTTTTCHNNGAATPAAVATPDWGTASANCTICHANAPATGEHAKHFANTTYVSGGCADCHAAETATTHINGTRNMASKVSAYTPATGTCTNSCHTVVDGRDWTSNTSLACADCHGSGKVTTPALDRGFPTTSGAHSAHVGNTAYVTGSNCTNCHNDNSTTHSTLNNVVTTAIGVAATKITANPGDGSCTNDCHAAGQASDWTGGSAAVTCVDCHSGTYVGGGANGPTSGLHTVTPTITGQLHNDTVAGGCAACHTSVSAQATHIAGSFTGNGSVAGDRTAMGLATFYTNGGTDNNGTCLTTGCHTGRDDWEHKWASAAGTYTTDVTACVNCHGMDTTFNTGVVHRDTVGTWSMHGSGASYSCKDCHALEASTNNYTFVFGGSDWGGTSQHGNGTIEINSTSTSYNQTNNTCEGCHTNDGTHNFVDTGWTIAGIVGDGINGSCNSCHGYPPLPGDGKTNKAVEGKGAHAKHVTHIAALAGVTLNETTDTFTGATSTAVCGVCHNVSSDTNHSTGGGSRNMLIPTSYQFGASVPSYNGTENVSSSTDPKSCSSVSCHFKETPVWAPVGGE